MENLSLLMEIAERAIVAGKAAQERRAAEVALKDAYADYRVENDSYDRFDGAEWEIVKLRTKQQYEAVVDAKNVERNANRRLKSSVDRYLKGEAAKQGSMH